MTYPDAQNIHVSKIHRNVYAKLRVARALKEYRNNGLSYWKYLYCKNYALNTFVPNIVKMLLNKKSSGYAYIKPFKLLAESILFPNFYLSFFYFIFRQARKLFGRVVNFFIS